VEQRIKFIEARLSGEHSMVTLCRMFGISTKAGYKWWHRFEQEGMQGLLDRSRASHRHPNATPEDMVTLVIGARRRHPTWGPRKLGAWLEGKGYKPPVPSTIGDILRREGLVRPKRRRPRPGCFSDGLSAQQEPNAVWAADFKGHFKLRTGAKCYPLTISDGFSRYLLRCEALRHPDRLSARRCLTRLLPSLGCLKDFAPTTARRFQRRTASASSRCGGFSSASSPSASSVASPRKTVDTNASTAHSSKMRLNRTNLRVGGVTQPSSASPSTTTTSWWSG
jgi:transposase